MRYPKFDDIIVSNAPGVSPVAGDTTLLARAIKNLKPTKVLEIGTGTGFVPIFLGKHHVRCDATDITESAIVLAKQNAKRNNISQNFFVSDLFQQVKETYDLVCFNPPFGNTSHATVAKYLEVIKSFIPKKSDFAIHVSYSFIARQRRQLILRFLSDAKKHLRKNGSVVIFLYKKEIDIANSYKKKKLGEYKDFTLYQLFL